MKPVRVGWKLGRITLHLLRGWWIIRRHFPALEPAQRQQHVHVWAGQMLQIFGIRLVRRGHALASGPVLLVANHVSWLDILVMHASGYCRFISKADVRRWPLIGEMADQAGTLFIERESRRDAHRMVQDMAERLKAGDVLVGPLNAVGAGGKVGKQGTSEAAMMQVRKYGIRRALAYDLIFEWSRYCNPPEE